MPSDPRHARGDSKSRSNAATCLNGTLSVKAPLPLLHAVGIGVVPLRYPPHPAVVSNGTPDPIQINWASPDVSPFSDCAEENNDNGALALNSPKPPRMTAAGGPLGFR